MEQQGFKGQDAQGFGEDVVGATVEMEDGGLDGESGGEDGRGEKGGEGGEGVAFGFGEKGGEEGEERFELGFGVG